MPNDFIKHLDRFVGCSEITGRSLATVQVNLGLLCNLECHHCHLAASPRRREVMRWTTMTDILAFIAGSDCQQVDLTGGAPEMNPHFKPFVEALRGLGVRVQVRSNLTVLLEPEMADFPAFFRDHGLALVGSMPCYLKENVDSQRGSGVYDRSVEAIRRLNALGYGVDPELVLNLVYNPGGPFLPGDQRLLEADYRRELFNRFGIYFTHLLTIANMPIGRFLSRLRRNGEAAAYWNLLKLSFNSDNLTRVMCRDQISVGWDGKLYDCDFNLALDLPIRIASHPFIHVLSEKKQLRHRTIVTGNHCFACTAGRGSSCAGELGTQTLSFFNA
ncbi:MAG: arsenosugar biosynthesis radical SAM protein ArsS [Magnetococcus sp. DMHC-6]